MIGCIIFSSQNAVWLGYLSGETILSFKSKFSSHAVLLNFFVVLKYMFDRCPQLETLSLKRSNMAQAVLDCPLLHLLDIGSCHKLSDAAIRAAATSCPQLESLDMSNCSCVSDETLREIALTCVNLHILDASYCPNISLEVSFLFGVT